jgi:hypothetical protein
VCSRVDDGAVADRDGDRDEHGREQRVQSAPDEQHRSDDERQDDRLPSPAVGMDEGRHGLAERRGAVRRRPEGERELRSHDDNRSGRDEAGEHRVRHQVRDDAGADEADDDAHDADEDCEQQRELDEAAALDVRERRQRAEREERRNGRRSRLEVRRRGEERRCDRRHRCGVQAAIGRQARELRVRERLREEDERDARSGDDVSGAQVRKTVRHPVARDDHS